MGSIYVIILVTIVGLLLIVLLTPCTRNTTEGYAYRFREWLKSKFLMNFIIMLILESTLELSFTCMLNYKYVPELARATTFFQVMDYLITAVVIVLVLGLPFFILIFYCKNFDRLKDEEFEDTWGAVYEAHEADMRASLWFNVIFMIRRILFAVVAIGYQDKLWLQMTVSMIVTLFSGVYLVEIKPFTEPLLDRLEVFNELTSLLLFCVSYTFSEMTDDHTKSGYLFIVVFVGNMIVHLYFMLSDIVKQLYRTCRYTLYPKYCLKKRQPQTEI